MERPDAGYDPSDALEDPGEGAAVQVDKEEVVELLRSRGEHDKAAGVECALPRHVDTEADAGVLQQFDVKVSEIATAARGQDESAETPLSGAGSVEP
jgi:hypothetical protein